MELPFPRPTSTLCFGTFFGSHSHLPRYQDQQGGGHQNLAKASRPCVGCSPSARVGARALSPAPPCQFRGGSGKSSVHATKLPSRACAPSHAGAGDLRLADRVAYRGPTVAALDTSSCSLVRGPPAEQAPDRATEPALPARRLAATLLHAGGGRVTGSEQGTLPRQRRPTTHGDEPSGGGGRSSTRDSLTRHVSSVQVHHTPTDAPFQTPSPVPRLPPAPAQRACCGGD